MAKKIHRAFKVDESRALQITTRVRHLVGSSEIDALQDAGLLTQAFTSKLVDDLLALLHDHDAATIEGRWNALVNKRGIYAVVGADAFLYDPGYGGLEPDTELVADDGTSLTIQDAMRTAWEEEIPIEAIPRGLRLDTTEFRITDGSQLTLPQADHDGFDEDALREQLSRDLRMNQFEVNGELLPLEDVEFPSNAPRQECVLAVAAAGRYIRDHGGASREEIVDDLEPEKQHPLGINGAQARAKGFEDAFRATWWADVVAPGLRALPDIQAPASESGMWLPTKAMTGGFTSEDTVETILNEGYLFEVAYTDDTDPEERRIVGYHDQITRPSAKPLDGPPVFRFQPLAGETPITIRLPELRELHPMSLDQLPDRIWEVAPSELVTLAAENAAQIPRRDVERVLDAVQHEQIETAPALTAITVVLREREDIREAIADEIEALLLAHSELLTEEEYAAEIAKCFGLMAEFAPPRVLDAVPAMASAASSADPETRRWLVYTFTHIADEYPEELLPAVDLLIDCIEGSDDNLRTNALSTLGKIAHAYPDAASNLTTSLGELLTSEHAPVRANAAGLLGDIAQEHPDAVIECAPGLAGALTAEDEDTRVHASIALLRAGEADPEAVRAEHDHLAAGLTDSHPTVRANCCTLIGNADAPVPVDNVRALTDDPDEEVREQAAWALDRLT